jgi:hypothetical protein
MPIRAVNKAFSSHRPFNWRGVAPMAAAAGIFLCGCSPENDPMVAGGGKEGSLAERSALDKQSQVLPTQPASRQESLADRQNRTFVPVSERETLLVMRGAVIEPPAERLDGVTERFNPDGTYARTGPGNLLAKWFTAGNRVCLDLSDNFPDSCRYLYRTDDLYALSTASSAADVSNAGYIVFRR